MISNNLKLIRIQWSVGEIGNTYKEEMIVSNILLKGFCVEKECSITIQLNTKFFCQAMYKTEHCKWEII